MAYLVKFLAVLAGVLAVKAQYEPHQVTDINAPVTAAPVTITVQETVFRTHPLRYRTTSDVWVTETTNVQSFVTNFLTVYSYIPSNPRTVTSVIRVTSTPVFISTIEIMVHPTHTMTSVFTSFVTTTQTVNYWQSITHLSVVHSVETIPVWSTQTLVQEETTTVTQFFTTEITSTTKSYHI